jgi:hypothetical protein
MTDTGGVSTGADAAPGHATGLFASGHPMMDTNEFPHDDSCPQNGHPRRKRPSGANTPHGPAPADAAERFRRLIAELIARQIVAERQKPPAPGGDDRP